jgi:cytoskeletal protein RodZ
VDYADFGRYLSQQRELRGVSREDVAKLTRIPLNLLVALEMGQVERLPGRIFVLNYIRAYARAIGLEAEEAVLRFEEIERGAGAPVPEAPAAASRGRKTRARLLLAGGVAVLLAAAYGVLVALGRAPFPRQQR